jgi:hypothetical protein
MAELRKEGRAFAAPGDRTEGLPAMYTLPFVSHPTAPLETARAWVVDLDVRGRFVLASTVKPYAWPVRAPAEARCLRQREHAHGAPTPGCGCGLWGLRSPEELVVRLEPDTLRWAIVGVVEQWGRTAIGEEGVRSEFARPLAIVRDRRFLPGGLTSLDGALRRAVEDDLALRYDLPVLDAWPALSHSAGICA